MYNYTTIAIVTAEKSEILRAILHDNGIQCKIENNYINSSLFTPGFLVRIDRSDLTKVLEILKKYPGYEQTFGIDVEKIKMKRMILVPIDFSEHSQKACEFAFNYAFLTGSPIKIFHAYFSPLYSISFPDNDTFNGDIRDEEIQHEMYDIVKSQLDSFVSDLKSQILNGKLPDVEFSAELSEGIPEEEIQRWANLNKPSIIIMGTRGKSQKEADMLGSVTAEVIDSSKIPVIAIPDMTSVNSIKDIVKIGFVTNFDQRDLICFYKLMDIAGIKDKKICFLCLSPSDDTSYNTRLYEFKKYINEHYKDKEFEYINVDEYDLLKNTDEMIQKENINLLTITTHKRNVFARLFNPSIAHKVIFHSDTPLLVIRN